MPLESQAVLDAVLAVADKTRAVDAAITTLYEATMEADRRDPRLIATLRQRYEMPQKMALVAKNFGDLAVALGTFSNVLGEFFGAVDTVGLESKSPANVQGSDNLTRALGQISEMFGPKSSTEA